MNKSILVLILLAVVIGTPQVYAAKKFVPKKVSTVKKTVSGSLPAIVKYRGDKLGLLLSFSNFSGIQSASYVFTYNRSGIPDGASGTITANNNPSMQRELLFGTCSGGVCTYHHNLTSARLLLTVKMTNGRTISKGYNIKTYQ